MEVMALFYRNSSFFKFSLAFLVLGILPLPNFSFSDSRTNIWLLSGNAFAAPIPGTALSEPLNPYRAQFWKRSGFSIELPERQTWQFIDTASTSLKNPPSIRLENLAKGAFITLRDFEIQGDWAQSLRLFQKDFQLLGMRVLRSQEIKLNPTVYVFDVITKDRKQLRQYLWRKDQRVINLNCGTSEQNFSSVLVECNRAAQSFSWTAIEAAKL